RLVEGPAHLSLDIDTLRHGKAPGAWHQRLWLVDVDVVLVVAALVGDIERVTEAFGRDQRRPGALALDDRVRGEGRSVNDHLDPVDGQPGVGQHAHHAVHDARFGGSGSGQYLLRVSRAGRLDHHVG